jgi:hypothetical protein
VSEPVKKKKGRPKNVEAGKPAGSLEARKMAEVVLEVLSGAMTPTEAAESTGMSVQKYYMVESRALDGLVLACEPRKRGYVRSAERELEALKKKHAGLERECARYQALARASRRAVGLRLPKKGKEAKDKKGRRKRKPTVRALTHAKKLKDPQKAGTVERHGGRGEGPPALEKGKREQTGTQANSSQKAG